MPTITQVAAPAFGTAITLAVLSAESRRLPLQNVVALALISMASAAIIEGIANTGRSIDLPRAMAAVPLTTASLLASRAIARLPQDQREVLVLSVYEHLSQDEIATITDSTVKAVELRLYRARKALREELEVHFAS